MISTACALNVLNISQKISGGSPADKDLSVSSNHIAKSEKKYKCWTQNLLFKLLPKSNLCNTSDHLSSAICVLKSLDKVNRSKSSDYRTQLTQLSLDYRRHYPAISEYHLCINVFAHYYTQGRRQRPRIWIRRSSQVESVCPRMPDHRMPDHRMPDHRWICLPDHRGIALALYPQPPWCEKTVMESMLVGRWPIVPTAYPPESQLKWDPDQNYLTTVSGTSEVF